MVDDDNDDESSLNHTKWGPQSIAKLGNRTTISLGFIVVITNQLDGLTMIFFNYVYIYIYIHTFYLFTYIFDLCRFLGLNRYDSIRRPRNHPRPNPLGSAAHA